MKFWVPDGFTQEDATDFWLFTMLTKWNLELTYVQGCGFIAYVTIVAGKEITP
jgi:hypothetical protein